MANNQAACTTCETKGICGGKGFLTLKEGAWTNNPLAIQVLGICSALAVTNRLENSLVMGAALIFVCIGSNLIVSLLRKSTPHRIRMIAEVAIIATFVIIFDQFLKAFYWEMSKQLGPYVGLIITNCIVMGRAEAFALQNPPVLSIVDGAANGLGYAIVLAIIGFFRELLGTGEILGHTIPVFSSWYTPNQLMILAPGAFFALGIMIGIFNAIKGPETEEDK
ncbi:NADH:ubiquinone reductase (Na(+)-transporting) subunit D [Planctomycetota bacterium]